jgi:hypothetical protein
MAVLAGFPTTDTTAVRSALRATDEIIDDGERTTVVLTGCDEFDAGHVLARIGVQDPSLRLADRRLLLAGAAAPRAGALDDAPEERTA